tara:strand:+ start:2045 stop:2998 length:954 start_codon:yes stop_codon:yes gene_type:complete
MTIAPGTGDQLTAPYYAGSTGPGRWLFSANSNYGFLTLLQGYEYFLANQMQNLPPGPAPNYPARRLAEIESYKLTQQQLHENRMQIVMNDPWLQSMVPGIHNDWSNHSIVQKLEQLELEGKPIAHKYLHALIASPPPPLLKIKNMFDPNRRRELHWVPHEHPPPSAPPHNPPLPPGAEVFAFPGGVIPAGWHMVPMWGGTHQTGVVYGQPDSHDAAYTRGAASQAAHILAPNAWEAALAEVLRDFGIDAHDIHSYIVGDKVQYLIDVNATTVDAVVGAISGPYFESALSAAAHATIVGKGSPYVTYHSHGLVPDSVR